MFEKLLGRPLFGRDEEKPLLNWWWHSQNLDERPGDGWNASGSKLMHGRAWLHMGRASGRHPVLQACWSFRASFCHLNMVADSSDRELMFGAAFPPVSFWVGAEGLPEKLFEILGIDYETVKNLRNGTYLMQRRTEITVHGWSLWWSLWMPEHMTESNEPKWRRGNFSFLDALFGRPKYERKQLDQQAVLIPMPERHYRGNVVVERRTHSRPRWPFRVDPTGGELFYEWVGYQLDMEKGEQIPFPGKGENSWDCGDDALFGRSGHGGVTEAIADAVKSVFNSRRRNGGSIEWKPEPEVHA